MDGISTLIIGIPVSITDFSSVKRFINHWGTNIAMAENMDNTIIFNFAEIFAVFQQYLPVLNPELGLP